MHKGLEGSTLIIFSIVNSVFEIIIQGRCKKNQAAQNVGINKFLRLFELKKNGRGGTGVAKV